MTTPDFSPPMLAAFIRARVFLLTEFRSEKQVMREMARAADVSGKEFAAARAGRLVEAGAMERLWRIFGFETGHEGGGHEEV
jgi:hypothetical protein